MFSFDYVKDFDPEVAKAMEDELGRQRNNLELIASAPPAPPAPPPARPPPPPARISQSNQPKL